MLQFEEEARRTAVWLRAFFMGPTGSGKSRGALELAIALSRIFDDVPVTLINSERGRGKLYADRYKFGYIGIENEESLGPETWIEAIDICEDRNPGGIIVADSVTHEYAGRDGILQRADRFGDWKEVRPMHNAFVERIIATECHFIACCRAKMQYEVTEEDRPGNAKPRQVVTMLGVGPIQDKDFQYEFNLVGRFDLDSKDVAFSGHVDPLIGTIHDLLSDGEKVAAELAKWLSEGDPIEPPAQADDNEVAKLRASLDAEGYKADKIDAGFAEARRQNRGQLHPDYVADNLARSEERLEAKRPKPVEDAGDVEEPEPVSTLE